MQSQTTQIVDQAIENLDADAPVVNDPKDPKGGADDKTDPKQPAKDDAADKPKPDNDAKKPADEEPAKPKYDKDGKRIEEPAKDEVKEEKPKEGEFTADDAIEEELPQAPSAPPKDSAGIQLSPDEQKFIVDNIGEPIVISGFIGTGDEAKPIEIKAYSPNDIPKDFKFANDQQLLAAQTGFYNLENKANQLLGSFRQTQSTTAAQQFEERENEGIRADVADLQKDGKFPKFTVRPGEAGFDDSPEAKQMSEVLAVMTERNELYLKQYEQGRPYKHIGFAEAFELYESRNPARQEAKQKDDAQKSEDQERKTRGAENGASNRGTSNSNIVKPTIRPGTSTRDILNRIDNEEF